MHHTAPILSSYVVPYIFVAVGIDLGTTYSVIGYNSNGNVVIVPDKNGRKIFPSIVTYLDNGGNHFMIFKNNVSEFIMIENHPKLQKFLPHTKLWLN